MKTVNFTKGIGYSISDEFLFNTEVIQFGGARSGTTLMWQILSRIFLKVWKCHSLLEPQKVPENTIVFMTIREPWKMALSLLRVEEDTDRLTEISPKKIDKYIKWINDYLPIYKEYDRKYETLKFRYKDFYKNFHNIFNQIEKYYGKIPEIVKTEIREKFNLESNIKNIQNNSTNIKGFYSGYFNNRNSKHISKKDSYFYLNQLPLNTQNRLLNSFNEFNQFIKEIE